MLFKLKRNKCQEHFARLPKISQSVMDFTTLFSPVDFRYALLDRIRQSTRRICIVALYLENDESGQSIFSALYKAKKQKPHLDVSVVVDWHRAQRCRIGSSSSFTNADWYYEIASEHPNISIPIYGVPVNTREALGVLHLKGSVIDDTVLYTGANFNNIYLHQNNQYRHDRYQIIDNRLLANTMFNWIDTNLLKSKATQRLDQHYRPRSAQIKHAIKKFRQDLKKCHYQHINTATSDKLSVTPLLGLGKRSLLNKTIYYLIVSAESHLVMCTPYFNLPDILVRSIIYILRHGKKIEIIVGDKTANDFYVPDNQPFQIIGILPYLYEVNLRRFLSRLQYYIYRGQLTVRLWKDGNNSYHFKGLWVDETWMMITGNNFNPRAWSLDLENAILIHDPLQQLANQRCRELNIIRKNTVCVYQASDLECISDYPDKVRRLILGVRRMQIDRLLRRIL
ncbi:CDP-diacylglycerol--serine O-phosphatidyltransferase [Candidatus Erwinia haradaeae]|uniref:CDP-diacylglycerol--serine O-phosphatidyltransferase n=1 Tax=Candidatus Erwinia haradaeae TaxID=1922217 RepID=A0A803GCP4_9GAMM|nr:CDP-diacylglycerol--serine O-phosphatidyltransferase [Candidatus Erwinia haradaeae]VFP88391.1 CDP-diacylglycerol--serine O-phosphatidyltransferase [Candidatus Erwinia haradaeae]